MHLDLSPWMARVSLILLMFLGTGLRPARAASPQQINEAVARGVKYLYSVEKEGNWEMGRADPTTLSTSGGFSPASRYGGYTAIATYALLAAGEKTKDNPKLQAAVKWLMKADLHGTYAVALRAQVWLLIDQSAGRDAARDADAHFLLNSLIQKGANAGFYGYNYGVPGQKPPVLAFGEGGPVASYAYDRSNSQYGVLGVWAAEQAGADIPEKYWEIVDSGWRRAQQHDGGWNYRVGEADPKPTATMTCAGVASLFITQDYLLRLKKWDPCAGATPDINIENGLIFVEKHIQELLGGNNHYGMYGVERIATASGRRYFGSIDWFQLGADATVQEQHKAGEWGGSYGPVADTSLAILFLSRGRAPVMINKLQYAITLKKRTDTDKPQELDPWNERPRDIANLTHWVAPRIETTLNWQIVNLSIPPEQLHDAPILYISGNQALSFTDDEIEQDCARSCEQGGMIFGTFRIAARGYSRKVSRSWEPRCSAGNFGNCPLKPPDFHRRAIPGAEMETASARDPGDDQRRARADDPAGRMGMPVVRGKWKFQQGASRVLRTRARIFFSMQPTGKNLFYKGEPYIVLPKQHAIHPKSCERWRGFRPTATGIPNQAAGRRLSAIFHNTRGTQLDAEPVKLGSGKLADYSIAHLTGTTKVIFSEAQRQELKQFVTKGGTLIIDAAGGDAEFANSIEADLRTIFGKDADAGLARPLPMDAAVFSAGAKIAEVGYRVYATRTLGNLKAARICGISVGGRIGVFYSREDISGGLVGQNVDGIIGYNPASATQLMSNMITFAQSAPLAANTPAGHSAGGILDTQ